MKGAKACLNPSEDHKINLGKGGGGAFPMSL